MTDEDKKVFKSEKDEDLIENWTEDDIVNKDFIEPEDELEP